MLEKMELYATGHSLASAINPADKDRELRIIARSYDGGLAGLQRVLKGILSGSLHSCKLPSVQWALMDDKEALGIVLSNPLQYFVAVCCSGNVKLAKQVTEEYVRQGGGVNKYYEDIRGHTALSAAAQGGFLDIVRFLDEEKNALLETKDSYDVQPLMWAAQNGQALVVNYLASKVTNVDTAHAGSRSTALMAAARCGFDEIVNILLDRGANVNARDVNGASAICCAAFFGHLSRVKCLRWRGANISFMTRDGRNAFHIADDNGHKEVVAYLKSSDDTLE